MSDRSIARYDPALDQLDRHPEWQVKIRDLGGIGEVFDLPRRLILVDPVKRGECYAVAHALAHLDLGHVRPKGGGAFTPQQEADAHWLASMRIDLEPDPNC